MRYLLSTAAAVALFASPALAQTGEVGDLREQLSGAGFEQAEELQGVEIMAARRDGMRALVLVMPEGWEPGSIAAAAREGDMPAETGAIGQFRDRIGEAGLSGIEDLAGAGVLHFTRDDGRQVFVLLASNFEAGAPGETGQIGEPDVDHDMPGADPADPADPDMPETDID